LKYIIKLIVSTIAVFATAYLLPGVSVDSFVTALLVAAILGLMNSFLRPLLVILTIPVTVFTFGLFILFINAGLVILTSRIIDGFHVSGFWPAFFFSIVLSVITSIMEGLDRKSRQTQENRSTPK
jgi:putative membrane protein